MTAGIKTYNSAVNVTVDGTHVIPIARTLQAEQDFRTALSAATRRHVVEPYRSERMFANYGQIFDEALGGSLDS